MRRNRSLLAVVFVAVSSASPVAAAPFIYVESVSGDLSDSPALLPIGSLDVGLNAIAGSLLFCSPGICAGKDDRDLDYFTLSLPAELRITRITLEVSNFGAVSDSGPSLIGGRLGSTTGSVVGVNRSFRSNGSFVAFASAADGPGDVALNVGINSSNLADAVNFDYQIKIAVEEIPVIAVPEPASLALLGAGLLGLAAGRRRVRQR